MCGCLLAYWLGYKFGKKAVKWCAGSEEDYDKWSSYLNKKGKLWYLITVMFPFFPDDLLCLVAGAVKFDFVWYTIANVIGRGIGLLTMILFLKFIGIVSNGIPIMLILWAVALVAELVTFVILKSKQKKISESLNEQNQDVKDDSIEKNILNENDDITEKDKKTSVSKNKENTNKKS